MALQDHVGRREEEDRRATRARKAPWGPREREAETGSKEFVGQMARALWPVLARHALGPGKKTNSLEIISGS